MARPDDEEPDAVNGRDYGPVGGGFKVNMGLDNTARDLAAVTTQLSALDVVLNRIKTSSGGITSAFSSITNSIKNLGSVSSGMTTGGGLMSGAMNMAGNMFGSANEKGWVKDFMMFPTRYMRSNILDNRQLALTSSAALGPQAFGSMAATQDMMRALAGQFGNNRILGGNPQDLLDLTRIGSQVGAGLDWRYYGNQANPNTINPYGQSNSPRAAGFLQSVYEAQRINPGESVGKLATSIGQQLQPGLQQQSAFLTGGAFSMIGAGNRQKPISEWASGILKWLSNLRPGAARGTPFTYPELMSQNFPGSNIDAWLQANGITDDMKTYFWSYALASSQRPGSAPDKIFTENAATTQSVAYNRLKASGAQTQTGFQLAGQMSGAYANKEQSNQWFAELMGSMMNTILPSAMSSGLLSYMQFLPDSIEEMMMQLAERTNLGALGAGVVGWGSQFPQFLGGGDVGDVGDYGSMGAASTAGMHPDARKKVNAMMRANPRLRVNSGHRDLAKQQTLKRKGVGRVSGRPSAHTRGMAADLGPSSEYPWIVRNARKFGLQSGAGVGEPWHVGMGDVGDPVSDFIDSIKGGDDIWKMGLSDTLSSLWSGLFGGITAFTPGQSMEEQASGMAGGISGIMKALMGIFTQGSVDQSRLSFRDIYGAMVEGTNRGTPGLPTSGPSGNWWSDIFHRGVTGSGTGGTGGTGSGGGPQGFAGGAPVGASSGTLEAFYTDVLNDMGAPVNHDNLVKLAAIAKTEGNKSGTFNPFNSTGGKQFPAFNMINGKPGVKNYPDWATGVEWTANLLQQTNTANWRNNLMGNGSYEDWWAATNAFYTWGRPAQISYGRAEEMLTHQINAGDIDYAAPSPMSVQGRAPMLFNNTFNVQSGGGGGGSSIDMRRMVTMLADQLEDEMKRRLSRTN